MIKQVAESLGPLRPKVVFLGGSATDFHITDEAEPEIRATKGCRYNCRSRFDSGLSQAGRDAERIRIFPENARK
jgi:hypothetical protein